MVMFLGSKSWRLDAQFPGHAKMNPDPAPNVFASPDYFGVAAREFEEHLFSPGERAQKSPAGQLSFQRSRIRAAKDSLLRVELDRGHLLSKPWIPLPAKKFHLGQFRHRAK